MCGVINEFILHYYQRDTYVDINIWLASFRICNITINNVYFLLLLYRFTNIDAINNNFNLCAFFVFILFFFILKHVSLSFLISIL